MSVWMASTISCTATCAETEAKCFHAPHADQAYFLQSLPWTGRSSTTIALLEFSEASLAKAWKMTWMKVPVEISRQIIGRVWILQYFVRSIWISFLRFWSVLLFNSDSIQYCSQDLVQSILWVLWSASWARPYQLLFLALVQPFPGCHPRFAASQQRFPQKDVLGPKHNDHKGPSIYDIHPNAWHNYASFTWRHSAIFRIHRLWMGFFVESERFECKTCG